jgi:hypothetical protein
MSLFVKTSFVAEAAAGFSADHTSEIHEKSEKAGFSLPRLSGHRRLHLGSEGWSVSLLLAAALTILRRESVRSSKNLKPEARVSLARKKYIDRCFF